MPKNIYGFEIPTTDDYLGNKSSEKRKPVKSSVRREVCARQRYRCFKCDKMLPATYHIHHKNPKGSNRISNLVALCPNCHAGRHHDIRVGGGKKGSGGKKNGKKTSSRDDPFGLNILREGFKLP